MLTNERSSNVIFGSQKYCMKRFKMKRSDAGAEFHFQSLNAMFEWSKYNLRWPFIRFIIIWRFCILIYCATIRFLLKCLFKTSLNVRNFPKKLPVNQIILKQMNQIFYLVGVQYFRSWNPYNTELACFIFQYNPLSLESFHFDYFKC